MIKKLYFILSVILLSSSVVLAQSGSGTLKGKILDKDKKNEPIPFASIIIELNGTQIGGAQSDFDGNYTIKPIPPGKYTVKAQILGYQPVEVTGVIVSSEKISFLDINMTSSIVKLVTFEKVEYVVPLISKDNTASGSTVTKEEIKAAPTRNLTTIVANSAGIYQADEGRELNVRGTRAEATYVYIDGIKVRIPTSSSNGGSINLPKASIEQISTITGGVPAQYGDATGGIINITTRGPSKEYGGGIEALTSELLDPYGYNLISLNASGPIYSKKDSLKNKQPVVGFFINAEVESEKDGSPSAIGMYKVKDAKLKQIEEHPLISGPTGGTVRATEYVTMNDLEKIDAKQNVASKVFRLTGKIDFRPTINTNFTVGGSFDYDQAHNFTYTYALFNPNNNPLVTTNTWRTYARFTQRFNQTDESEKSAATVRNIFYSIQGDYSSFKEIIEDDTHKDRIFDYGYIGKFTSTQKDFFMPKADTSAHDNREYMIGTGITKFSYDPSTSKNPIGSNYTKSYYDIVNDDVTSSYQVQQNYALLNGDRPSSAFGIWFNTGRQYNGYTQIKKDQVRITAQGSADIKNHAILAGIEFEQRTERYHTVGPLNLWGLMRLKANEKRQLVIDSLHAMLNATKDTVRYPYLYVNTHPANSKEDTIGFYENIRTALGLQMNDWIDIDSYSPSQFKINYFTPSELLNGGDGVVYYYGYDPYGNEISGKPNAKEFFTKKDNKGIYTRPIGAFMPNYVAGYIQDKFAFNDLIFNIGVRIDRFDANQPVLKDRYLLFESQTASDTGAVRLMKNQNITRPSNIGDNYVVYVDDYSHPTKILGYRNDNKWYDLKGTQISDPGVLAKSTSTGVITPYLKDSRDFNDKESLWKAFKDYEPQINFMPRIAFSFPISDEALFFAHYDVLTQRPSLNGEFNPISYLFMQSSHDRLNNPDLKPERTTDYELGFKQKVSKSSSFTISAFYKELKNMIRVIDVNYAFPIKYTTYGNIDFGTVKGISLAYDLRRTNNVSMKASYTLQFADGTGSSTESGFDFFASTQPDLRTPKPLDFDQRHLFITSLDFRFGEGDDYNGPVWFKKQFFANAGINLVGRLGSGVPYTKWKIPVAIFDSKKPPISGSVNGSRLPWQFSLDARIDKDFELTWGKKGDEKKSASLNVYLQIQNVLNIQNVLEVYSYTGNPDDDGWLATTEGQKKINEISTSSQSFQDLYLLYINNPSHYSLPRRIRLGIALNF